MKPKPTVEKVTAATSGNEYACFTALNVPVTNDGAKGTVLIVEVITQAGLTQQQEFTLFPTQGETRETEMTFPLRWGRRVYRQREMRFALILQPGISPPIL